MITKAFGSTGIFFEKTYFLIKNLLYHGKEQGNEWLLACKKHPLPINH